MPRSSRPASKRRQSANVPPRADARPDAARRTGASDDGSNYGSVDGKRYAGTLSDGLVGPVWGDEGASLDAEHGFDEWE